MAKEAGFTRIILEGDAFNILKELCSTYDLLSCYGHILDDARSIMQHFEFFSVSITRRMANGATHALAKMSHSLNGDHIWVEEIPSQLAVALDFDCNPSYNQ